MTKNVFFIDGRVSDYQILINALPMESEWHLLSAHQDGIEQMASILASHTGLDSIQVLSHGSSGALYLGNTVLNHDSLYRYEALMQDIGASLTETGDLLLYGCNVAAGSTGVQFIQDLARITGADVAASDDLSGPGGVGGDSVLEQTMGGTDSVQLDLTALGETSYCHAMG